MPFTPKFVDLVRNFATVLGTGPVALGAAVSGYTGLAQALSTGDQFYYCLQSVDKPQEREVGRGTLQADGKIAREPISGGLTNFSNGTKTISLVAAAEWFTRFESGGAGGGGASIDADSLTTLAAKPTSSSLPVLLTLAGREGLFCFESGDRSALVAADPRQGLYVAPQSDPSGASGAWVRRYDGPVNVRWFGAKGDGTTNDGAAFAAALAALKTIAANDIVIYKGSNRLRIPAGHYYLGTTTLDVTHTLVIEGDGVGQAGGTATKLRWAANTTGIRIQRGNTSGVGTVDSPSHSGGDATILRGLHLAGAYTNYASEGPYHAVHAKARFAAEDVFCQGWQGDGFHIVAHAGGGAPLEGNANCFQLQRCTSWYCQNGIYLDSWDANAGSVEHCDFSYARQWGYYDTSALGNTVAFCHFEGNGVIDDADSPKSICSYSGRCFYVVKGGESWAATNAPPASATDNQGWRYYQDGGPVGQTRPAWVTGMAWRAGGIAHTGGFGAVNWVSNYFEGGQVNGQLASGGVILPQTGTPDNRYGGSMVGTPSGLSTAKSLGVGRDLTALGFNHMLGPDAGAAGDTTVTLRNTNGINFLNFDSHVSGVLSNDGYVFSEAGIGLVFNGKNSLSAIRFRANNANIATVKSTGVDLASGKVLMVGGTQVVGVQGAALPADATDLPTAIALVNAVKARLRATGGHGLVAD